MLLPVKIILSIIISYLLGSIPTAYLFGRLYKGIDIRQHGSGNVGATNAFRVLGKIPGTIVLLLDIAKGTVAVALVVDLLGLEGIIFRVLAGIAVVIGHNWTVFLQFKGGKGIATGLGVLIGLTIKIAAIRPVLLLTVATWAVVFLATGYVSVSSVTAATLLPLFMLLLNGSIELIILGVIFCIFVVLRHRPNIKRLIAGTESRVNLPFRKKK
ncbi:MAG TPA: glycerol-3-phosphate 1-O-acyltransferase PlsY [Candidatus Omnitrophota bacterium]|nr:glycerol-3-phosphate 1-O-acyltransferase PlsY [Candidatus Omnitrophota bacterium]HPD84030.1 glycerol-3-phosphate 1-O-acyltransferase PlsY [Candidatus Omnitrophota bacterium]HRZ02887.1 glycerol-3-phosphate 1-O-acyltransferase PlsY [Candidatus Omnitrophota bacterium]